MKNNLIWIIEDDQQYRDTITTAVHHFFKDAEVQEFATERDAEQAINFCREGKKSVPSLVISDVMLPYAFPEEGTEVIPEDWTDDSFRSAGVRLWKRFRGSNAEGFDQAEWVYHTVLQPKTMDFENNHDSRTKYLGKDRELKELGELLAPLFNDIDKLWDSDDEKETEYIRSNKMLHEMLLDSIKHPLKACFSSLD